MFGNKYAQAFSLNLRVFIMVCIGIPIAVSTNAMCSDFFVADAFLYKCRKCRVIFSPSNIIFYAGHPSFSGQHAFFCL